MDGVADFGPQSCMWGTQTSETWVSSLSWTDRFPQIQQPQPDFCASPYRMVYRHANDDPSLPFFFSQSMPVYDACSLLFCLERVMCGVMCVAACTCARVSGASGLVTFWFSSYSIRATPCKLAPFVYSLRMCLCVRVSMCVCVVTRYVISNDCAMLIQYKTWLATNARIASRHAYYHVTSTSIRLLAPLSRSTSCPQPS